jgi:hypothetical protein
LEQPYGCKFLEQPCGCKFLEQPCGCKSIGGCESTDEFCDRNPIKIIKTQNSIDTPMKLPSSFALMSTLALLVMPITTLNHPAPANAQTGTNNDGFMMPSRNIYCAFTSELPERSQYLRCELAGSLNPMPSRDRSCNLDWGNGLVLPKAAKAKVLCAGDTIYSPNYPILRYGQTWKKAGFTCKSATNGLTCTNGKRQGFFLNREEWRTF